MKRHLFGTAGLVAALIFAGCADDPTDPLRGSVVRVQGSRSYVELSVGQVIDLAAQAFDEQGNAVRPLPTVTSSDEAVAMVTVDTRFSGNPVPETNFTLTAVGAGQATLTYSAGGVTGETTVIVFPLEFDGTVAVNASGLQDIVTISGTSAITFDPAATAVSFGDVRGAIVSISASEIQVAYPGPSAYSGPITLDNLLFLGSTPITTLETASSQTLRPSPFTASLSGAPDLTAGPFPMTFYLWISDVAGVNAQFAPAADLTLVVDMDWDNDADVDILWLDPAGGFITCGSPAGCTGAQPEQSGRTVPGGTTELLNIYLYSGDPAVATVVISQP